MTTSDGLLESDEPLATEPATEGGEATGESVDAAPPALLVRLPRSEVIGPVVDAAELAEVAQRLSQGTGPIAVDAERASGYRYSQRAYLIQLWREGVGIVLIDPIQFDNLDVVQDAIGTQEWALHAASQDLACLREVGLSPKKIFDTETAGRLLGMERVSLNAMLEVFLGITLEKGHSAADWSTRPLPADWLTYAALDVDLLIELRNAVAEELDRTGKREWAEQEFEATLNAPPPPPRAEPWRRTSGIHILRSRRQLAQARSLWEARDEMASARDIAPGRVLPDSAIVAAVKANPATLGELSALPVFRGPRQRRQAKRWFDALEDGRRLNETDLPTSAARPDAIPAPSRWRERDPVAAARLAAVRETVVNIAAENTVQVQNLLAADVIRRICWQPPLHPDESSVSAALAEIGARPWQISLCALAIAAALAPLPDPPPLPAS
ncbi:MAG: 3-5 exonuclease [Pseudonocardiales bacterium]|nr:3-5 exonuclease [Pseudonocardiales bacterium]